MQIRRMGVALLALAVGACETPLTIGDRPQEVASTRVVDDMAAYVMQGIARAMTHRDARASVIEVMRRSPIVEHKVRLLDAFDARVGDGALLRRTSAALGIAPDSTLSLVASLGDLEFYGENATDRQSWTADGYPVVILYSLDNETATEYHADGTVLDFRGRRDNVMEMVIAPPEPHDYRIGRPAVYRSGAVIEDPNDGGSGLYFEMRDELGRVLVSVDVGRENMMPDQLTEYVARKLRDAGRLDLLVPGDPGFDMPSHGPTASEASILVASTYGVWFANDRITDGVGSAEIELKTWRQTSGSTTCCEVKVRWTGVGQFHPLIADPGHGYSCGGASGCISGARLFQSGWYPGSEFTYTRLRAEVWETDSGPDDHYGTQIWNSAESNAFKVYYGIPSGGNANCSGGGTLPCAEAVFDWF